MAKTTVQTSLIVRVVDGRQGRRIVLHDLRAKQVIEFSNWEAAIEFMRAAAEKKGLR